MSRHSMDDLTKIARAVVVMEAMSLPKKFVLMVLDDLLKTYGDWRFIEADNYHLLADMCFTRLEEDSKPTVEPGCTLEPSPSVGTSRKKPSQWEVEGARTKAPKQPKFEGTPPPPPPARAPREKVLESARLSSVSGEQLLESARLYPLRVDPSFRRRPNSSRPDPYSECTPAVSTVRVSENRGDDREEESPEVVAPLVVEEQPRPSVSSCGEIGEGSGCRHLNPADEPSKKNYALCMIAQTYEDSD